jgi:uncharacterized protein YjbJ (UPF0337 family)
MTDIAEELSRRASPRYIGQQVRETALNKTQEWKEDLISSPTALGLIGGVLGAAIGRALARSRRDSRMFRRDYRYRTDWRYGVADGDYGYTRYSGYPGETAYRGDLRYGEPDRGVGEKISETKEDLKDRAGDMVDRAKDMASGLRDRIPSAAELSEKAEENPIALALGGLALGAVAALLLPVTRKERDVLQPVKERAGEAIGALGNRLGESAQQVREKIAGSEQQPQAPSASSPAMEPPLVTH